MITDQVRSFIQPDPGNCMISLLVIFLLCFYTMHFIYLFTIDTFAFRISMRKEENNRRKTSKHRAATSSMTFQQLTECVRLYVLSQLTHCLVGFNQTCLISCMELLFRTFNRPKFAHQFTGPDLCHHAIFLTSELLYKVLMVI